MSVDEMIARLPELDKEGLRLLREALDRAETSAEETAEERWQRGEAALDRLMQGFGTAGGKCLSEGIDEALYGGER